MSIFRLGVLLFPSRLSSLIQAATTTWAFFFSDHLPLAFRPPKHLGPGTLRGSKERPDVGVCVRENNHFSTVPAHLNSGSSRVTPGDRLYDTPNAFERSPFQFLPVHDQAGLPTLRGSGAKSIEHGVSRCHELPIRMQSCYPACCIR